jgi:hypothetical protein
VGFWPAGIGDIATGLLAPVVGLAYARAPRKAAALVAAWNVFGILENGNRKVCFSRFKRSSSRTSVGTPSLSNATRIVGPRYDPKYPQGDYSWYRHCSISTKINLTKMPTRSRGLLFSAVS